MPTPLATEHVEIDGLPLYTEAWYPEDISALYDIADPVGDFQVIPYRRGAIPFRRQLGPKRIALPLTIVGDVDPDGVPHADLRAGLLANRDRFVREVAAPPQVGTVDGTRLLRYHTPTGDVRSGPVLLAGGLRPTPIAPGALGVTLSLDLVEGGLRSETLVDVTSPEVSAGNTDTVIVPNPGGDYQDALTFILTGSATSVRLTNLTAGDVWWEFGGGFGDDEGSDDVTVDTLAFTAIRTSGLTELNVVGLVTYSGFERWLPLVRGDNVIEVAPQGGTATVQFLHFPFYP